MFKRLFSTKNWLLEKVATFWIPLSVLVVVGIILSVTSVSIAIVSKNLIDTAVKGAGVKTLHFALLFVVIILAQVLLQAASSLLSTRASGGILNQIQQRVYQRLSKSRWSSFAKYHSGDLMTRLTSDAEVVTTGLVTVLPGIISLGFRFVFAFIVLCIYDPILAILAFILGPLALLFSRYFGRRLKKYHTQIQESESQCRETLNESIQNMLVVKTFSKESQTADRIALLQQNRLNWTMKRTKIATLANSILSFGFWIGYFLAFGWGAYRLYMGTGTFGTLTAFLQLVGQVQGPFVQLAYSYPQVIAMISSSERIIELEKLELDRDGGAISSKTNLGIKFEDVSFSYPDRQTIFNHESLEILPGQIVALVGPSGIGKTTFIQLLLALLYPDAGTISLMNPNGEKIEVTAGTRNLIAYVPQGNTLFSGSVTDNLRIGKQEAKEAEMRRVCEEIGAWDFIEGLPEGFNTRIGEKGFGLSEGQSQRIAIARAILKEAPILILDEATSALDIHHEKQILEAIKHLQPSRTCLIITHRSSALSICDRVLKIEEGKINEVAKLT